MKGSKTENNQSIVNFYLTEDSKKIYSDNKSNFDQMFNFFTSIPEIKKIFDTQKINITFTWPESEANTTASGVILYRDNQQALIYISPAILNNIVNLTDTIFFELCNANNPKLNIFSNIAIYINTYDVFSYCKEYAEHFSALLYNDIVTANIESFKKFFKTDSIALFPKNFEEDWIECHIKHSNEMISHAEEAKNRFKQLSPTEKAQATDFIIKNYFDVFEFYNEFSSFIITIINQEQDIPFVDKQNMQDFLNTIDNELQNLYVAKTISKEERIKIKQYLEKNNSSPSKEEELYFPDDNSELDEINLTGNDSEQATDTPYSLLG